MWCPSYTRWFLHKVFPYHKIPCVRINFWLVVLGLLGTGTSVITSLKQSVLISCCFVLLSRWVVLKRDKKSHGFIWFCCLMHFMPFPPHPKFAVRCVRCYSSTSFATCLLKLRGDCNKTQDWLGRLGSLSPCFCLPRVERKGRSWSRCSVAAVWL